MPVPESHAAHSPPEPRYEPLVIVLAAAAAGVLADRLAPLPLAAWSGLAAAGVGLWFVVPKSWRAGAVVGNVLLLAAVAATAGAWHHCRWTLFAADDLGCYARRKAEPVCIEAVVVDSPRALPPRTFDPMQGMPKSEGSRCVVDLRSLRNGATWQPVSGRATLLVLGKPPPIAAGDRVRCFAKLLAPAVAQNPGASDDSAQLRADRVRSCLEAKMPECISTIQAGSDWNPWRLLHRVRMHSNRMLERYLDPRQAELAAAVLLGFREELDFDRRDAFLTTGTVHILCIAGLHVGILAGALFWLMRQSRLPRGWCAASIAVIIVFYAMMVDARPSVVRATILVLIACVAVWRRWRSLGFNSLAAAALVVLAINPAQMFHVGVQLSFLCVAGLMWFASRRPHWDDRTRERRTLERLVADNLTWLERATRNRIGSVVGLILAGMLLWLLTLPLVLARFHIFSPVALVMNAILLIPMSLSLISGFGVLIFGTIVPPLGSLCGWVCNLNFRAIEDGIDLAQRVPHFWLPGPADWWLWGFYGALGLAVALPRLRPRPRWCAALLAAWIAVGFAASALRHDRHRLDCTFLSVGHGIAVFLEFPSGQTMLYDAGQMGSPHGGARAISEFLWNRGLTHLDAVVLSHPDIDHYNALPEVLKKFSVGAVYVSPIMFEKDTRTVAELRRAIDACGVPVHEVWAGDRLRTGDGCRVEVLHPPRDNLLVSSNANSLVLAVECHGHRVMLPGDLESPGLDDMLAEEPLRCDVLLAPHHGSRKSNSPGLAAWCKPCWVVFSGDGRWDLPEIDATYQAVGAQTLHTCNCGAIRAQFGADGVRVTPFVEP